MIPVSKLYHTKQSELDKSWYHLYVEPKKWHKWTFFFFLQKGNRFTILENKFKFTKGVRWGME